MTISRAAGLALGAALSLVAACSDAAGPSSPTVFFSLDAPLCGFTMPMQFFIDSVQVGTDTFHINAGAGIPNRTLSAGFHSSAGAHRLGAKGAFVGGVFYTWPDTLVTLTSGANFTLSLPLYCS